MNVDFFKSNSYKISELLTKNYSTSFSFANSLLEKDKRNAVYAVYGFVRLADEIVDSFHDYNKEFLLDTLQKDLDYALHNGISINPVLLAFADTVKKYEISREHIDAFLLSMKYDLTKTNYETKEEINQYIYGSADVIGLMCLKIFCNGDAKLYKELMAPASSLGSAFQKVNFLRDLKVDAYELGRFYFPELLKNDLSAEIKQKIVKEIKYDFSLAKKGIRQLPGKSRLAVYVAYCYYNSLLKKINNTSVHLLMEQRIRISNFKKIIILVKAFIFYTIKLI